MEMCFFGEAVKKTETETLQNKEKGKWNYPRENNESVYFARLAQTLLIFLEFHEIKSFLQGDNISRE